MAAGKRRIEPLAAIYAREAFVREGLPILLSGDGALRSVIDRLNARFVEIDDDRVFANVNTRADYDAIREVIA
jgi:molybdopterin-guanine dinucleotide biosynthesis protein A